MHADTDKLLRHADRRPSTPTAGEEPPYGDAPKGPSAKGLSVVERVAPVLVREFQVLGGLLGLIAVELLQADVAREDVALVPHNPSESHELVVGDGDDLSHDVGRLDVVSADPDEAVGVGLEGVDADAGIVEAHGSSLSL